MTDEAPTDLKPVPRHTKEDLKQFVQDVVGNRIFLLQYLPPNDPSLVRMVFLVLGLGGVSNVDPRTIGTIYEYLDKAGPRAINGYPMFMSCRLMHKDDWAIVAPIIERETEKAKSSVDDAIEDAFAKEDG